MDKIISLAKRRGFVFPGSEIYGGLANSWDFGPLGVELKNNLRDWWWKRFVQSREDMVGIDAAILMNAKVWEASGHLAEFSDPLVECKSCHERYRADQIDLSAPCEKCGKKGGFTEAKQFNMMFKTAIGTTQESSSDVYLRPELAQAMFVNFKNVLDTMRKRLPFGIASVGKAFRNEITPGNFIFRTLEFDLMEFEYFIQEKDWQQTFVYWLDQMHEWLDIAGIDRKRTRVREHTADELSHYSKRTVDIEFETPFGWKELYGCAYRTNFDLSRHQEKSGKDLSYFDAETNQKMVPHVIEPTFGLTRSVLMVLFSAYTEETVKDAKGEEDTRVVLKLNKKIAPFKVAVLPLSNKLNARAEKVWRVVSPHFTTDFDVSGSIGKRYRRQDEIGTPYCVTVDFDSENDHAVTVRDRDTMAQERIALDKLVPYLQNLL